MIVLETPRLRLRPLTVDDVDLWIALHADERVNRFVGEYTRQAALDRLVWVEKQWSTRGHNLFAIEDRASGEFLGRGGLHYWEQFDEVEAGWTLRAEAWGHGYATEAVARLIRFAFEELGAQRLTAGWFADNPASGRVLEKLGCEPDGEEERASLSRGCKVICHKVVLTRAAFERRSELK